MFACLHVWVCVSFVDVVFVLFVCVLVCLLACLPACLFVRFNGSIDRSWFARIPCAAPLCLRRAKATRTDDGRHCRVLGSSLSAHCGLGWLKWLGKKISQDMARRC